MSELDELREKMAAWLWALNHIEDEAIWEVEREDVKAGYRATAKALMGFETDTLRIAVVGEGKLPENPYTTEYKYQCSMDAGMPLNKVVDDAGYVAYRKAQRDMLKAGYVKEVKDGTT